MPEKMPETSILQPDQPTDKSGFLGAHLDSSGRPLADRDSADNPFLESVPNAEYQWWVDSNDSVDDIDPPNKEVEITSCITLQYVHEFSEAEAAKHKAETGDTHYCAEIISWLSNSDPKAPLPTIDTLSKAYESGFGNATRRDVKNILFEQAQDQYVDTMRRRHPWLAQLEAAESGVKFHQTGQQVTDKPMLLAQQMHTRQDVLRRHGLTESSNLSLHPAAATEVQRKLNKLEHDPPTKPEVIKQTPESVAERNALLRAQLMMDNLMSFDRSIVAPAAIKNTVMATYVPRYISKRQDDVEVMMKDTVLGPTVSSQHENRQNRLIFGYLALNMTVPRALACTATSMLEPNAGFRDRPFDKVAFNSLIEAKLSNLGYDIDLFQEQIHTEKLKIRQAGLLVASNERLPEQGDIGELISGDWLTGKMLLSPVTSSIGELQPFERPTDGAEGSLRLRLATQGDLLAIPVVGGARLVNAEGDFEQAQLVQDNEGNYFVAGIQPGTHELTLSYAPESGHVKGSESIPVTAEAKDLIAGHLAEIGLTLAAKELQTLPKDATLADLIAWIKPYTVYGSPPDGQKITGQVDSWDDIAAFTSNERTYGVCTFYAAFAKKLVQAIAPQAQTSFVYGNVIGRTKISATGHVQLQAKFNAQTYIIDTTPSEVLNSPSRARKDGRGVLRTLFGGLRKNAKNTTVSTSQNVPAPEIPQLPGQVFGLSSNADKEVALPVDVVEVRPEQPSAEELKHQKLEAATTASRQFLVRALSLPDAIVTNDPKGTLAQALIKLPASSFGRQLLGSLIATESAEAKRADLAKLLESWLAAPEATRHRLAKDFGKWQPGEIKTMQHILADV